MTKASVAIVCALLSAGCSSAGFDVAEFQRTDSDVDQADDGIDAARDGKPENEIDSRPKETAPAVDSAIDAVDASIDSVEETLVETSPPVDSGIDAAIDSGLPTDSGAGGEDAIVCARWCAGSGSAPLGSPCSSASDCCSELCDFCAGGPCCKPQDSASSWCGGRDGTPEWCAGVGHCVP